jgi:uncharacterized protein (TIGR03067 family)
MARRLALSLAWLLVLTGLAAVRLEPAGAQERSGRLHPGSWEFRAHPFPVVDHHLATRMLNQLAADGWEYVGPLPGQLMAFKRPIPPSVQQKLAEREVERLQGAWRVLTARVDGKRDTDFDRVVFEQDRMVLRTRAGKSDEWPYQVTVVGNQKALALLSGEPTARVIGPAMIFEFEGDGLKIAGNTEGPRPVDFNEKSSFMLVLKRERH